MSPLFPSEDQWINSILTRDITPYGAPRIPFFFGSYLSTKIDIRSAIKGENFDLSLVQFWNMLQLGINPSSLTLTPFIRIAEARTGFGKVYYNWVNERGSVIEAYELSLNGVTGNLFPGDAASKRKLYLWMKFRELTLEPREISVIPPVGPSSDAETPPTADAGETIPASEQGNIDLLQKRVNDQFILIRTTGIPTTMLLIGFYKIPITFSETAAEQYNHSWSCTFVVTEMYPRYEELSKFSSFSVFPEILASLGGR